MKFSKLFFFALLILGPFDSEATAQPACVSTFSAFDTCNPNYFTSDYIFLGKVLSLEEIRRNDIKHLKARVAVEEALKGHVDKSVEVTMPGVCVGIMSKNKTFIFLARRARADELTSFYSSMWSTPVDEIGRADLTKLLEEIRALLRGTLQTRITGSVIAQGWNPSGKVYTARSWLNPQLGYDPKYAHPLAGIVVLAENNGKQFKSTTDAHGSFQFNKLPAGKYEVRPLLPTEADVYANGSPLKDGESYSIEINSKLCGVEVNFDVQQTGNVTGRLQVVGNGSKVEVHLYLVRAEPANSSHTSPGSDFPNGYIRPNYVRPNEGAETVIEFGFDRVPIGPYVLFYEVNSARGLFNFFYPAVKLYGQAEVITVKLRKETDLKIKVGSLN